MSIFVNNAPVTISYAFISLIFLLLSYLFDMTALFALHGSSFVASSWSAWMSLFTYSFVHLNTDQLMANMMYFLLLGPLLEEKYGRARLFFMMILTNFIVAFVFIALGGTLLFGASALVFMMIVLASFTHYQVGKIPLSFVLVFGLYVIHIIGEINQGAGVISQLSHIVGGISGMVFGFFNIGRRH